MLLYLSSYVFIGNKKALIKLYANSTKPYRVPLRWTDCPINKHHMLLVAASWMTVQGPSRKKPLWATVELSLCNLTSLWLIDYPTLKMVEVRANPCLSGMVWAWMLLIEYSCGSGTRSYDACDDNDRLVCQYWFRSKIFSLLGYNLKKNFL